MGRRQWDAIDEASDNEGRAIQSANSYRPKVSRLRKHRTEEMYDYGTLCKRPISTGEKHRNGGWHGL